MPNQNRLPTPVSWRKLKKLLRGYDSVETQFLIDGFKHGFKIPFHGTLAQTIAPNSRTINQSPQAVLDNITTELQAGKIAGPFDEPPLPFYRSSPIALVPKKDSQKFRTIHNLSYPYKSGSVNEGISAQDSTVQYSTFSDAIRKLNNLPPRAFLAKSDIRSAFRLVPIHPDSYHLLGFTYDNKYYYDKCLPFGLACSCQIFERFSRALEWILTTKLHVQNVTHLLDDFLFMGSTYSECNRYLLTFIALCDHLGIPIAHDKTVSPTHQLTFLGITINTLSMQTSLPQDKVDKCRLLVNQAFAAQKLTLRQLQSLIGTLNFACSVILPGRPFLRRLINLSSGIKNPFHHIRLTRDTKNDLHIWLQFLESFNGKAFILYKEPVSAASLNLYTDAAQSIGFGATLGSHWLQSKWPESWKQFNISVLELYPILVSVHVWAHLLKNHTIIFHCDNMAVVHILNSRTAKDPHLLALLRHLVLLSLKYNINFRANHIPGLTNSIADKLSRFQAVPLQSPHLQLDPSPTPLPPHLIPDNFIW